MPGCGNANAQDVDEQLITDDPEFNINDDKIVQSVLYDFDNIPSIEEIEESKEKISFNIAYSALQTN